MRGVVRPGAPAKPVPASHTCRCRWKGWWRASSACSGEQTAVAGHGRTRIPWLLGLGLVSRPLLPDAGAAEKDSLGVERRQTIVQAIGEGVEQTSDLPAHRVRARCPVTTLRGLSGIVVFDRSGRL